MEPLDFSKGSLPLYMQIKKIIKNKILTNEYAPGDAIPSEAKLQRIYKVSRITARQAMIQLESEGLVERERGRGTRVIYQNPIEEELIGIKSFTKEMKERNIEPGTRFAHMEIVKADDDVAHIFNCISGDDVFQLSRVRTGNQIPIAYFITYFPKNLTLPLDDQQYQESIYDFLETLHIPRPTKTKERIHAIVADKHLAEQLDMKKGEAVLVRKRISYDKDHNVLEYTQSYYPGERYSYAIDLE